MGLPGEGIIEGLINSGAAQDASKAQQEAAKYAADLQYQMFGEANNLQEPFRQGGLWALNQLIGTEDSEGHWEYKDGTIAEEPEKKLSDYEVMKLSQKEKEAYLRKKAKMKMSDRAGQTPVWVEPTTASTGLLQTGAPKLDFNSFKDSPWYTLQRDEGIRALESSAAGRGMLQSGNTGKALMDYGSDYAYGKALEVHQTQTNDWINTQLNPLLSVLGSGQVATSQMSGNAMQTGTNLSNTALYGGEARASGYLGNASAWTSALARESDNVANTGAILASFYGG